MSDLPRELGDFVLEKLIGQGGMGEVYLGRQKSLDRPVAVKLLRDEYARDESFIARFKREAKSAAKLIHPNIIQVYQLGEANGEYYFAMEYVEGKDLQVILKENRGKLNHQDAVRIVFGVAKALEIAGQFGIVHRDIKPSNVLITKDNSIKVMDFGLAKAFQDSATNVTMSGAVMGTANYMSPEQAEGKEVDQRTDIYSLGVMFYQLLTGYLPFSGENPTSLAFQHVHSKPIPPMDKISGVSKALNDICVKCLAKKKEDRYQNASEMLADLQAAADGSKTNYDLNSSKPLIGKTLVEASSEATIVNSADPTIQLSVNDRTYAPSMTASTKVESSSVTQADPRTIPNTVVLGSEKTEVKLQDVRADSSRMDVADKKQKSGVLIPVILVIIVIAGIVMWAVSNNTKDDPKEPKTIKEMPKIVSGESNTKNVVAINETPKEITKEVVNEAPKETPKEVIKEAIKETPKEPTKETVIETPKEVVKEAPKETTKETSKRNVEVSLEELKARLPKGFKIRVGVTLDEQSKPQNLDNIKSINRLSGTQMIELSHPYYSTVTAKINIDDEGNFSLDALQPPKINSARVTESIDNFFLAGHKEELSKMLGYGFSGDDLKLLKDRISILNLEGDAIATFNKGGTKNLVKAYNLIAAEEKLSSEGEKQKKLMKEAAEKDPKIRVVGIFLEEVKETLITNKYGMTFEIIDAGEFIMGSSSDAQYPKRKVKITKKFAMGRYEVTNKEYREIFKEHISASFLNLEMNGEAQPVVYVSWEKAKKFCEKLSEKDGRVYRLPTEAEWEYCARAGVVSDFSWGSKPEDFKKHANVLDKNVPDTMISNNTPFASEDGFVVTAPVGSFPANRFKLFDMDGNVKEWVSDYYIEGTSLKDGEVDPKGPSSGTKRCVRGASFKSGMKNGGLINRQGMYEEGKAEDVGFRIVLEIEDKKE